MMATADGRASTPSTPRTGPRFLGPEKSGLLGSALLRERARSAHSQGEAARLAEAVATLEAERTQLQAQVRLVVFLSPPFPRTAGDHPARQRRDPGSVAEQAFQPTAYSRSLGCAQVCGSKQIGMQPAQVAMSPRAACLLAEIEQVRGQAARAEQEARRLSEALARSASGEQLLRRLLPRIGGGFS